MEEELLSPAEADWPLQLRLPSAPPPSGPQMGMDDSQFLGSIMGEPAQAQAQHEPLPLQGAQVVVKKKRGRPPKNRDAAAAVAVVPAAANPVSKAAKRREDEEEVVCFICFDGGDLVVCDRRRCPKVYHPACIKRDAAFFQSRSKWNCGWHICSSCEKAVRYMCYSCTYSVCKVCIKQGKFFSVRGTKGFCDTCFGTILLIESKDEGGTKVKVDFDDRNSWEYLFKLYWLDLKGKLSLTMEEVTDAKNRWNIPITATRKEKDDSSGDLYDANNDDNAGSDCSSQKRKRNNLSRKRGRKCQKENSSCSIAAEKIENATGDAGSLHMKVPSEGAVLLLDTKWASPELLEFVGHMRDGDQSFISQFDVQALLLDYIKKNDLRDPRRKSQIICDSRLHRLFKKTRVAHFEMLKLLEMQFLVNEASTANDGSQEANNSNSAQVDGSGFSETDKVSLGRKKKMHRKVERESLVNRKDYAAIDMHNINLIYLRRDLMEDLIDDPTFSDKIAGGFVRIKISGLGHKQDMYRLVKVIGTHKVPEKYSTGKKTTNLALEILNLNKEEIITMDTVSNQDFTEEECTRLRQSMKYGLISPLKVGDIQEKAMIFQSVRVNDWLENEKQRLGHLRDRASETGRGKELRECVEKLQLLNTCEERTRRINEVLEVHVDSHMDPDYESDEEMDDKIAAERNVNGTRFSGFFSPIKKRNHAQKICDISSHPKNLSKQCMVRELGAGKNSENLHSTVGTDIPKSGTNINSTIREAASLSSSGVTLSNEPEKVWHYKDPSGNVQGPFTLMQLSKWTTYFPRDLRVWLTFESEERSLLLTEVLSKQPKDFSQAASVTSSKTMLAGSGQNRDSPSVDLNIALSPVGYSMVNSSEITVQSTKYSVPERGSVNSFDDRLSLSTSSVPPKDATNSRVQYQTKHSVPSPGSPYEHSDSRHDRVQGRCSGEWNKHHSTGGPCSPEMPQTSCSGQSNVESHHNQRALWSKVQHDSKINLQAGSVKDLDSRLDYLQTVPSQLIRRDVPSPVLDSSPSESRTASSQHESPCLSSTTNTGLHDELHSSISSENAKSCTPATLVEDRGSSSPSGMLSQLERVPICSSQSVPYASISETCKMEEVKYQQKPLEADASNASVNQSPQSKMFPDSSTDNQDIERECPSPTPRSESKEPAVGHPGSTPVAPEISDTKIPNHPPVASVSPKSGPLTEEIVTTRSVPNLEKKYVSGEDSNIQKELYRESKLVTNEKMVVDPDSCTESINVSNALESVSTLERRDLKGGDSNIEKELCNESTLVTSEKMVVNPASCAELIDVSDVLESVPNLEKRDTKGGNSNIEKELCSESTPVTNEKMVVGPASCTESVDVSRVLESVSNLVKRDLKGEESNIKKELFGEPTVIANEKMVVDPASCAESIDVSDALESVPNLEKRDIKGRDSNIEKEVCRESTLVTSEKMVVNPGSCTESVDVPYVLESVSNLEKSDLEGADSNIQKELFSESTLVTNEKMVVNPASCADSIDVSDVLKSVSNLDKTDLKVEDSVIKKELHDETVFVTRENMVVNPASCTDLVDVSDVLESVSNLEKTDLKSEDSVIKKELHDEPVFVTRENMVVNSASRADLVDVSDVLESVSNLEKTDLKSEDSVIQRELRDESIFVTRESMVVHPASYAESIDVSDVLESVSNLEKTDLKGGDSNVQKELHEESTLFTIENMVVDPAPFAGPVDVSCVLESSIEQRCGTSCMDAIAALEEFMNNSGDDEPQCSSPIALSPWGEPSYYQGDSVDSVLWSVQDYPMNDMWSFPSPTPVLEHLSGVEPDAKGIAHVMDAVPITLEDNEIVVQRGATPGEVKVELANQGASTAWGLAEQVKPEGIAALVSPIDRSTGILDWQSSANGSSNMDTAWSTSQDPNLFSYERATPSVKTSHQETSVKQERTELDAANFGEALGNTTKSWNPSSTGNANRGSQRSHNRDRYSQISESWLLSSNYSRSSSGKTSRAAPRAQTQRGICKFYENGYCRKGSSCNYLHPSSLQ